MEPMFYVIDSKKILANFLRNKQHITIKKLNALAGEIQSAIPSVSVDVSHYSLSAALEDCPSMFRRGDDITISRVPGSDDRFEEEHISGAFNQDMPADVKTKFLTFFGATG